MRKSTVSVIALLMALIMLLGACGSGAASGNNTNPSGDKNLKEIGIAFELPLTGGAGWMGPLDQAGAEIALADFEDEFAAMGIKIKPYYNDHEAANDVAAANISKDIELYKVPLVVGTFSGPIATMVPVAADAGVVVLNCVAQGDNLVGMSDYLFNLCPAYQLMADALADYLYNVRGFRKLACMGDTASMSAIHTEDMIKAWEALGGEVVQTFESEPDASNYNSACAQVIAADPDVVLVSNTDESRIDMILSTFIQLGAEDLVFCNMGNRTLGRDYPYEKIISSMKVYSTDETIAKYESKYAVKGYENYEDCAVYVSSFYNTIMVIKQVFQYCVDNGMEITGENIKNAMNAIKTFDIQGGSVTLKEGNTVLSPIEIQVGTNMEDAKVDKVYYE